MVDAYKEMPMSDETDVQAAAVSSDAPEATAETTAADSQPVEQTPAPASEEQPKADAPSSVPVEPAKTVEPVKDSKPKSRRSAQFRIEQLARENAELRKQVNLPPAVQEQDDGTPSSDDESLQPDIRALARENAELRRAAREEAQRLLEPMLKEHSSAADANELNELFSGDRAAMKAEYEPKIRDAWNLPQYKDLAASDVYRILSYDSDLAKAKTEAITEYKRAQKEAKEASGSGTSARQAESKEKSAWEKTDEEFDRDILKAKTGGA